jgi:hypothetical protein
VRRTRRSHATLGGMQTPPPSAYASALSGIFTAMHALDADAAKVAADPTDVHALVDATTQPLAVAANAIVLRAAHEADRYLFDAWA